VTESPHGRAPRPVGPRHGICFACYRRQRQTTERLADGYARRQGGIFDRCARIKRDRLARRKRATFTVA